MELAAKSDQSTGNALHASYALQSGEMRMLFTAPYGTTSTTLLSQSSPVLPGDLSPGNLQQFTLKHGLAVRAVAIEVSDVAAAHATIIKNGGMSVVAPCTVYDDNGQGEVELAEVALYGDVVLRLLDSSRFTGAFLPNFASLQGSRRLPLDGDGGGGEEVRRGFGLERFDHIVGNLWALEPTASRLRSMTGFHDFAEFVAEDVGTVDSGLNSVVLANNNEMVLLPLNEPTFGTKRKSQIQTYLEQNNGEGVQHMALFTNDIFSTMQSMRAAMGGFEFMDPPGDAYYASVRQRLGSSLSEEQYRRIQELGLLADEDDQGVLLQVFTKPVGDRATLFLEIIQRIGCVVPGASPPIQKPGCGGFGKGNFKDLFKSIEEYEATLRGI